MITLKHTHRSKYRLWTKPSILFVFLFGFGGSALGNTEEKMKITSEGTLVQMADALLDLDPKVGTRALLSSQLEILFPRGKSCATVLQNVAIRLATRVVAPDERMGIQRLSDSIQIHFEKIVTDTDGRSIIRLDVIVFLDHNNLTRKTLTSEQREPWLGAATF